MRIGLLGGTFDPVHTGHLLLAQGALEQAPLDKIIWIPCHRAPHKPLEPDALPEERARMVQLAIGDNPAFQISRLELDRPAPSYTIDTIRQIQEEFQGQSAEWHFLIGSDAVRDLPSWRQINLLRTLVRFLVIPRPGRSIDSIPQDATRLHVRTLDISASEIRQRIREGRSIRYLVPEPVRLYIEEQGLYKR